MRQKKLILLNIIIIAMCLSTYSQKNELFSLKGPYLGQKPPGKIAEQFAPGIISTDLHDDASPAFTPDLDEIYFRIVYKVNGKYNSTIFFSKEDQNGWSIPKIDPFSKNKYSGGVYISLDGKRKYVRISKPVNDRINIDIALSERCGKTWGPLKELSILNTEFNEGSVFEVNDYLYWWTETKRNDPKPKLYRSRINNGEYLAREQVFHFPDSALVDFINMDGGYAVMTMKSENNGYDLFVSFKDKAGKWQHPINLGVSVNSKSTEKASSISPDGKYLFFVSSRKESLNPKRIWDHHNFKGEQEIWKADIYWVDISVIDDLRPIKPKK